MMYFTGRFGRRATLATSMFRFRCCEFPGYLHTIPETTEQCCVVTLPDSQLGRTRDEKTEWMCRADRHYTSILHALVVRDVHVAYQLHAITKLNAPHLDPSDRYRDRRWYYLGIIYECSDLREIADMTMANHVSYEM